MKVMPRTGEEGAQGPPGPGHGHHRSVVGEGRPWAGPPRPGGQLGQAADRAAWEGQARGQGPDRTELNLPTEKWQASLRPLGTETRVQTPGQSVPGTNSAAPGTSLQPGQMPGGARVRAEPEKSFPFPSPLSLRSPSCPLLGFHLPPLPPSLPSLRL